VALRWKAVFLPAVVDLPWKPAEPLALLASGLAPAEALASFSRRAWSFCSFGLRPVLRVGRGFGGTSVMGGFYRGSVGNVALNRAGLVIGWLLGVVDDEHLAGNG
jgi:hypothetical protein